MAMQDAFFAYVEAEAQSPVARFRARAFGASLMLVTLLGMGFSLSQSVKAAGYVEDKGTLTVDECHTVRTSTGRRTHEEFHCTGVFRSARGRSVHDGAELTGYYVQGEKVRVYREASAYSLVSLRAFWGWLCMAFFCLFLFSRGLVSLVVGIGMQVFTAPLMAKRRLSGTPYALCSKRLALVGAAGLLLCFTLAAVSP